MITNEQLTRLLELAADADQGPWMFPEGVNRYGALTAPPNERHKEDEGYGGALVGESIQPRNGRYLQSLSPGVVIAMVEELLRYRARL